jgi:hypothetical protein
MRYISYLVGVTQRVNNVTMTLCNDATAITPPLLHFPPLHPQPPYPLPCPPPHLLPLPLLSPSSLLFLRCGGGLGGLPLLLWLLRLKTQKRLLCPASNSASVAVHFFLLHLDHADRVALVVPSSFLINDDIVIFIVSLDYLLAGNEWSSLVRAAISDERQTHFEML